MEIVNYNHNRNNAIRFDKNIAFNIATFKDFEKDANIILFVLLYVAINHQEDDLFGFYKIDPEQFAKKMGLNKTHLFRMHPNPYFIENTPNAQQLLDNEKAHPKGRMSEHRTWSTVLENALYILHHKTFIDDYRSREGDNITISSKTFKFFDQIDFKLVKTGKTHKIMYFYKPDPKYLKNLSTYFVKSKLKKIIYFKKPGLSSAYLYFLNRIANCEYKNINSIYFNINELADILDVKPYKRFSQYKIKITEKFDLLAKNISDEIKGFNLTWVNYNQSVKDIIDTIDKNKKGRIINNVAFISWERINEKEKQLAKTIDFKNVFDTNLNRSLIKAFLNLNDTKIKVYSEENIKKSFYEWFFSEQDLDIKKIKFKDTYVSVYKNTVSINYKTKAFVSVIKYISTNNKKFNIINYNNDLLYVRFPEKTISFKHLYDCLNFFEDFLEKKGVL